jgi:hypothetical protein
MGVDLFDGLDGATDIVSSAVPDSPAGFAKAIVGVAVAFLVGVLIVGNIDTGILQGSAGVAHITFLEQPADGDLFQLDTHIFEYDSNGSVAEGHIPVTIGTTVVDTKNNLLTAIASAGYTVVDNSEVIT